MHTYAVAVLTLAAVAFQAVDAQVRLRTFLLFSDSWLLVLCSLLEHRLLAIVSEACSCYSVV
jgi:hypothetical protein